MADNNFNHSSKGAGDYSSGPYLAKVVGHMDTTFMGMLEVQLLRPSGNFTVESELHMVHYMSPFYGVTSANFVGETDDFSNTQKSYGMWMIPPDVGTMVMVFFVDGDPRRGYWMGCVPDEGMNFMLPGLAATQKVVEDVDPDQAGRLGRVPVAEYNKVVKNTPDSDATQILKPRHPLTDMLDTQGLLFDDTRGITTSSARRETPSMVFGISTPGPVDKGDGAPRGRIGKEEYKIDNAFVGRLGGTTFVMDDGDDRFIRKTPAKDGPPNYSSIENGETDGEKSIPHNELVRIRTRTGHQILLHNSEDLIYITNSRGTAWIEFTSDGKIDIYAQDSISVRTQGDFNFYADRDFNFEAGRNINMKATGLIQQEAGENWNILVGAKGQITTKGSFNINTTGDNNFTTKAATNIKSGGNHVETAKEIHMNGPAAKDASIVEALSTFENPTETDGETLESIMLRIPTTEPYPHHENLDATMFKTDLTDRESGDAISVPDAWKTYSTSVDTFDRIPPLADDQQQQESGT